MKPRPHAISAVALALCGLATATAAAASEVTPSPASATSLIDQVLAQARIEVDRALDRTMEFRFVDQGSGDLAGFAAGEMGGRVVKGAPYCADAVHETSQTLADADGKAGNRIGRKQTTRLCRDGEGRTRQEQDHDGRKRIYLRDPVAGVSWLLDPERKTARRLLANTRLPADLPMVDAKAWRDFGERMREFGERMRDWSRSHRDAVKSGATPPVAPVAPVPPAAGQPGVAPVAPPAPVVISNVERDGVRNVEVHVIRNATGSTAGAPQPPLPSFDLPMSHSLFEGVRRWAPRGPGTVTPLAARDIEGLRANGERTTWTIEAGKVGNDKPIVITREVWTAPELMLTVLSRDFDPRSGEVSYRLTHIKRGEPDSSLFKVPDDYSQGRSRAPTAPARPGAASQPRASGETTRS